MHVHGFLPSEHTGGCVRAQSEQNQSNRKRDHGFFVSATRLCMYAGTDHDFSVYAANIYIYIYMYLSLSLCVCARMRANKRHAAKLQQHRFPQ